ncbi:MAG: major capsid protein [Desulfobacterales bacterium]|nr:major capsid protein [Desulfobacterales bacterium]
MNHTLYSTHYLAGVISEIRDPDPFVLEKFFPNSQPFDTETIDFDLVSEDESLAPFVSPKVAGKVMKDQGFQTKQFKPPYIKDKNIVDIDRPFKRKAGEKYDANMSPAARHEAIIADLLVQQQRRIKRRMVWMGWQSLLSGSVDVEGEDFPKVTVDFGRDAALTKVLTSTARWGESGVNPIDDLEDWGTLVAEKSGGAAVTDVVMDPAAWRLFKAHDDVKALLETRRGSSSSAELGPQQVKGARYKGSFGDFDVWVYSENYKDEDGVVQPMLPANTVILGGADIDGTQAYGAIKDPRAGLQATEIFPKNWINEDPAVEYVMSQSAPLVIPTRVNASMCVTVK